MVGKKKLALILSGLLVMTGLMSCSNANTEEKEGSTTESSEMLKVMERHILLELIS